MAPDHGACVLCVAADRANDAIAPTVDLVGIVFVPFEGPPEQRPIIVPRRASADPPARAPPVR